MNLPHENLKIKMTLESQALKKTFRILLILGVLCESSKSSSVSKRNSDDKGKDSWENM